MFVFGCLMIRDWKRSLYVIGEVLSLGSSINWRSITGLVKFHGGEEEKIG